MFFVEWNRRKKTLNLMGALPFVNALGEKMHFI